jgi:hypothetical protein
MTQLKLEVSTMDEEQGVIEELKALLVQIETLEPGGDLEGLIENRAARIKREVYKAAVAKRNAVAAEANFSPSGLSEVRSPDEADQAGFAPGGHARRPPRVRARGV